MDAGHHTSVIFAVTVVSLAFLAVFASLVRSEDSSAKGIAYSVITLILASAALSGTIVFVFFK